VCAYFHHHHHRRRRRHVQQVAEIAAYLCFTKKESAQNIAIFLPVWLVQLLDMTRLKQALTSHKAGGAGSNMIFLGSIMSREAFVKTQEAYDKKAGAGATLERVVNLEFSALGNWLNEANVHTIPPEIWCVCYAARMYALCVCVCVCVHVYVLRC
jgi:hypothetical protein